jgi:deoxyribodipyrimidine photolyase
LQVLWLRTDLRLHDNYLVAEAVAKIKSKEYEQV